jgi:acyl-CoA synthetase (AMP-forming)/AMP-acid ligase II
MRIDELLEQSARAHPNKTALICGADRWDYAAVESMANRAARAFIASGVARGDRIAICLDNGAPAVAAIFGACKAGAVAMPLHASMKAEKLGALLVDSEASALVTSSIKLASFVDAIERASPTLRALIDADDLVVGASAAAIDAGAVDAGPIDAGPIDAGAIDAGATDGGTAFDVTALDVAFAGRTTDVIARDSARAGSATDFTARDAARAGGATHDARRAATRLERTPPPLKRHIDLDLALLLYTSGSTAAPKGVMHTHLGITSVTSSIACYLELDEHDVVAQVLPLSFGYGLTQLFTTFAVGATLALEKSFAFPQATLAMMAKERATCFAMVPTIAALLARNDFSALDLSALRMLTNAGAALSPAVLQQLRAKLPSTRIVPMYGQTECMRASYLPHDEIERRPGSVGRGIPNQEMWLVDENGARVFGAGEGELVVRGAHVMRGYWRQPDLTNAKLQPGTIAGERVLHTGDLFRVDDEGFFYFVARKDDIIKTRGEKVSPREVEDALTAHPVVIEAAVIGVDDEVLGQAVHAYVTTASAVEERELLRWCAERIEDFAVPKRVFLRDALPKNDNGKIDKRALQ